MPHDPNTPLHEEHIVPLAFGADLVLPESSCRACEKQTSGRESQCINAMFAPMLAILGLKTRRGRNRERIYSWIQENGNRRKVPFKSSDHPTFLITPKFYYPSVLLEHDIAPEWALIEQLEFKFPPQSVELLNTGDFLTQKGRAIQFYIENHAYHLMIAKIGYAYAVARMGRNTFIPLIRDYISGVKPYSPELRKYVGSHEAETRAPEHWLSISLSETPRGRLIVVDVHLFCAYSNVSHLVVAGMLL